MLLSGQTEYGSRRGRCSGRREPATLPRSRAAELPGKLFDAAEAIPGRARHLHTGRKSRARRSQESRLLFEQIGGVPVVEHERAFHSRLRAFHRADQTNRGGRMEEEVGNITRKAHSRLVLAYFACGGYREVVDANEKSLERVPNNK
jgi:hypothetical protein